MLPDLPRRAVGTLLLTILGAGGALGLVATSARRTYRAHSEASAERRASFDFLMALRALRQHVGESRVGLTGYILTRDASFYATYRNGISGFRTDTTVLRALSRGEPSLASHLDRLGPALAEFEADLAQAEQLVNTRSRAELDRALRAGREALLLERIRGEFVSLEEAQRRLLDASEQKVAFTVRRAQRITVLAALLGGLMVIGAGTALLTQLIARERATSALQSREASLRESEERFREMATHIEEAFFIVDLATGRTLYVSPTWAEIWGRPLTEGSDPAIWFEAIHPDDRDAVQADQAAARRGELTDSTFRVRRPDGTIRWVRGRVYPVRNAAGEVYRLAGVSEDITDLRQAEQRYLQSQKLEAVGRLASGVAHDFNNLLTVILGRTDEALSASAGGQPTAGLRDINAAALRAAALTRQLLSFSRQQPVAPTVFGVNEAVTDLQALLDRLIGEDIELRTRLAADAGAIRADRGQFDQVLMNLVVNARDAMPDGGRLTIETSRIQMDESTRAHPGLRPGPYTVVTVADTGVGMTDEVKTRIFEPFFTTKEAGKGTGLGLATCYGIVTQAGGQVSVYSEVGIGTTFRVYLPSSGEIPQNTGASSSTSIPAGTETILIVEDNQPVRSVAAQLLRKLGYQVLEAGDASEAQRALDVAGAAPDLLLTDVVLPRTSGRELAEAITTRCPGIAILFTSGHSDQVMLQQLLGHHDKAILPKPFSRQSLALAVRTALDQRAGRP